MEWTKSADVVIIGGGILGTATAYYLGKLGVKNVVVVEKGTPCSGSGRCGARIRAQWGTEVNCRLAVAALDIFEQLEDELGFQTGLSQKGVSSGCLYGNGVRKPQKRHESTETTLESSLMQLLWAHIARFSR